MPVLFDRCACLGDLDARFGGIPPANVGRLGGEAALSVEARYLEPDLPDELQQAYAQTFDRLRRMFRARGCTPEEAADLAQDAAVRAFVHIRRWGVNGTGLDPLLNRIARNLLIDRYRRTTPHIVPLDDAGELHDPDQDPTEEVARRQRTHAVQTAIRGLPERHQTAITYSLNGLTPEEVGLRMGIGRNAADALLHRARRSLKAQLQAVGEGMFGVALGIRVRWDRLTRRAGGEGGAESLHQAAQSGVAVATVALVAAISMAGVGSSFSDGGAGGGARSQGVHAQAVKSGIPADTVPAGTGASVGGDSGTTYRFGPASHTFGGGQSTTHVGVPAPADQQHSEILGIDVDTWEEDGKTPMDQRYERLNDQACSAAPRLCWPASWGG